MADRLFHFAPIVAVRDAAPALCLAADRTTPAAQESLERFRFIGKPADPGAYGVGRHFVNRAEAFGEVPGDLRVRDMGIADEQ